MTQWNIPGYAGPNWSYDYLEAQQEAMEACGQYHADCLLSKCFNWGNGTAESSEAEQAEAVITAIVPDDANVYLNGQLVEGSGEERRIAIPGDDLQYGVPYNYTITAQVTRNGQLLSQDKQVTVYRAQAIEVVFDQLLGN